MRGDRAKNAKESSFFEMKTYFILRKLDIVLGFVGAVDIVCVVLRAARTFRSSNITLVAVAHRCKRRHATFDRHASSGMRSGMLTSDQTSLPITILNAAIEASTTVPRRVFAAFLNVQMQRRVGASRFATLVGAQLIVANLSKLYG